MITKNSYNKLEPGKIAGLICSFTLLIFYTFDLLHFCSFRNIVYLSIGRFFWSNRNTVRAIATQPITILIIDPSAASNTNNPRLITIRVTKKNLPNPVINILPRFALRQCKKAVTNSTAARDNAINANIIYGALLRHSVKEKGGGSGIQ